MPFITKFYFCAAAFSKETRSDVRIQTWCFLVVGRDNSFPEEQFFIKGYSEPFRLDRNSNGGDLLVYVKEDISSKQLKTLAIIVINLLA